MGADLPPLMPDYSESFNQWFCRRLVVLSISHYHLRSKAKQILSLQRLFFRGNTPIISNYFATESARNPKGVAKAVDALLESGLTMDPKLIKAAVAAHDKALDSALKDPNLVTTKADFAAVNEALARMIASANKDMS